MAFDWTISDDRIVWDGATEILSPFANSDVLHRGSAFRNWVGASGRERIDSILSDAKESVFDFEFQATSAMETAWFEVRGAAVSGSQGDTERIAGIVRLVTERKRHAQRLTYLATRDELTGHLNRTTLRSELGRAIELARKEERQCAYLVAAIDRLAVINEAYGFGAADEVIVAVSERLAASLRDSDLIGRIASPGLPDVQRTLNWVHLASRFPVRIRIEDQTSDVFRLGESAVVIIRGSAPRESRN